jgi:hypothetical protein
VYKIKGTCICYIRRLIKSQGADVEAAYLAKFTPEEVKEFHTTVPASWVSEAFAAKVGVTAGQILRPGDPTATRQMGRGLALDDYQGIYKVLFRIATIPFIMNQAPLLWKTYHDTGRAYSERMGEDNKLYFIVKDYPDMAEGWRELLCGYIQGVLEQTGGKNIKVIRDRPDADTWRWIITWA